MVDEEHKHHLMLMPEKELMVQIILELKEIKGILQYNILKELQK